MELHNVDSPEMVYHPGDRVIVSSAKFPVGTIGEGFCLRDTNFYNVIADGEDAKNNYWSEDLIQFLE